MVENALFFRVDGWERGLLKMLRDIVFFYRCNVEISETISTSQQGTNVFI